jgi:hypothetical protein
VLGAKQRHVAADPHERRRPQRRQIILDAAQRPGRRREQEVRDVAASVDQRDRPLERDPVEPPAQRPQPRDV